MKFTIRPATRKEMAIPIRWAAREGWNPGLYDADAFWEIDQKGYFIGFLGKKPIATLSAVSYGRDFGFLGFYIVKPGFRSKGYGWRLWQAALKHLPTQNIGLDGVVAQQENYKKSGFKRAYANIRFEGTGGKSSEKANKYLVSVKKIPLKLLLAYDRKMFLVDRSRFLKKWIVQPKSLVIGYRKDGALRGYGMVRPCRVGYKVGPLFADNAKIADELFQHMRAFAGRKKIYLDVPEVNTKAVALAKKYKMKPLFETARMYSKKAPKLPLQKIFGVTTFEVG